MNILRTLLLAHRYFRSRGESMVGQAFAVIRNAAEWQADLDAYGSDEAVIVARRRREIARILETYAQCPEREALLNFHKEGLRSDLAFIGTLDRLEQAADLTVCDGNTGGVVQ